MNKPSISLILPIYNVEPYLRKCLDSILEQDYDSYEVLMVDDGSPDNCPPICDEYAARDNRFRVFHKTNGGVSSARNVGLDNATGDWIWYVDPDDWIKPHSLSLLAEAISKGSSDLVFFGLEYYDEQLNFLYDEPEQECYGVQKDNILTLGDYPPQKILIRHDLIRKYHLRFTEGVRMGEDLEHQYKFLMLAEKVTTIPHTLYCCLRREGSAMRNPRSRQNSAEDSLVTARNLADFVTDYHIQEKPWLTARLQRKFKSVIANNMNAEIVEWHNVKECLVHFDKQLQSSGHTHFRTLQIRFALFSLTLYRLIFKIVRR